MKKVLLVIIVILGLIFIFNRSGASDETIPKFVSPPEKLPLDPTYIPPATHSFAGHECSADCSGHEAGYRWAEDHDIDDEYACETAADRSNSPSFGEGCKAFLNGEDPEDKDDSDDNENDSAGI
jgi:hypothetical protein